MLQVTNDMNLIKSAQNSVVAFTAIWCNPCTRLKLEFARASVLDRNKDYYMVDIDNIDKKYLEEYSIKSVPSVFMFNDGSITKKIDSRVALEIIKETE